MPLLHFSRGGQRGFTLPELLVALVISAITLTALLSFFSLQTKAMRAENARRAAQITARGTLSFIVRELEHIGRDPHGSLFTADSPAILAANEDSLHYRANLSQDWTADPNPAWEDVIFQYDPSQWQIEVVRQVGGEWTTSALTDDRGDQQKSYVPHGGLVFTYYDADGNVVAP